MGPKNELYAYFLLSLADLIRHSPLWLEWEPADSSSSADKTASSSGENQDIKYWECHTPLRGLQNNF